MSPGPYTLAQLMALVPSQFRTAPKFNAWLSSNLQLFQDVDACLGSFATAFSLTQNNTKPEYYLGVGTIFCLINTSTTAATIIDIIGSVQPGNVVIDGYYPPNTTIVSIVGSAMVMSAKPIISGDVFVSFGDILGAIIGQPRTVSFQPSNSLVLQYQESGTVTYVVPLFSVASLGAIEVGQTVISGSVFPPNTTITSITGTGPFNINLSANPLLGGTYLISFYSNLPGNPVLDDATYRLLLQARIAANHWNGQIDTLIALWNKLFPGGYIIVNTVGQPVMTVQILIAGAFTQIIQDLVLNGYILPRPQGVQYIITFVTLPIVGFDRSDAFIVGFDDSGHFA
jgi:hypothetical protein